MNSYNMKNDNQIQDMLDRFMAGTSTLEEEARLGDYFRHHEVKPEWQVYKEMFAYFDAGMDAGKMKVKSLKPRHRATLISWTLLAAAAVAALLIIRTHVQQNTVDARLDGRTASVSQNIKVQSKASDGRGNMLKPKIDLVAAVPTAHVTAHSKPVHHASMAHEEVAVVSASDSLEADSVMREAAEDMLLNYKVLLASQLQQRRALRTINDENIISAHLEALTTSLELSTEADDMKQQVARTSDSPRIIKGSTQASSNVRRATFMGFQ
jgi:hypothetical protein